MARYYTREHEWIEVSSDDTAVVGITDYAQRQLGDIVYVDLPEVGKKIAQSGECAVVESVKAASEVYLPVDGEIIEVNTALKDNPGLINQDSLQEGWLVKIRMTRREQVKELMQEKDYGTYLEGIQ